MGFFLDKIVFRLYDRTKSCRVNPYHTPFASLRRGFFLGEPVTPLWDTPEGLFFSHIDNPTEIKSLGVLLASTGTPPVALATPLKVFPIANTKDATR